MGLWSMAWGLLARILAQCCRAFSLRIRRRGCRQWAAQFQNLETLVTATANTAGWGLPSSSGPADVPTHGWVSGSILISQLLLARHPGQSADQKLKGAFAHSGEQRIPLLPEVAPAPTGDGGLHVLEVPLQRAPSLGAAPAAVMLAGLQHTPQRGWRRVSRLIPSTSQASAVLTQTR